MFHIACNHDRIFFSGIVRCLFWDEGHEDISAKRVALYVGSGSKNRVASDSRSDSLSTSPREHKVTKGWSDIGKAGSDGQPAGQRGEKRFKMYRREEQRLNSRGRRGAYKLDHLEMLLQRGG